MKKILLSLLLLTTTLTSAWAVENKSAPARKAPVNLLFVQISKTGSLTPVEGQPGQYILKLKGVDEYVQYFSDRPNRITGLYPTAKFIHQWEEGKKASSFNKMPPNAAMSAIELHLLKNKVVNTVVQLSEPSYNAQKRSLTYKVTILPGAKNQVPMKHLQHVALFIDSFCASCVGQGF
ncbi:hypothetical protein [Legionella sp. CNM-4043-24]|uniref:hypothetical protein n=1 Tax=Legionella sp. CNM-4043-24 TaxID=3421646 RepID=UPI00403AFDE5